MATDEGMFQTVANQSTEGGRHKDRPREPIKILENGKVVMIDYGRQSRNDTVGKAIPERVLVTWKAEGTVFVWE
jgi:hypothetical protein